MNFNVRILIARIAGGIGLSVALACIVGVGVSVVHALSASAAIDERVYLVLRGPELVLLETPVEFNADGVMAASGQKFGWEQIIQGNLEAESQQPFEQMLNRWGLVLFRLEQCLTRGDESGLRALNNEIPLGSIDVGPRYRSWIILAQYELALFEGHREDALLALVRLSQLEDSQQRERLRFPKVVLPELTQVPLLDPRLIPLWFDEDAARRTLLILKDFGGETMEPRIEIYLASLEIAAQEWSAIDSRLQRWADNKSSELQEWHQVFSAAAEVAQGQFRGAVISLENPQADISSLAEVVGDYWLRRAQAGRAKTDQQMRRAILGWLRFSLKHQEADVALAAAGLAQARELALQQDWQTEAAIFENELYQKYASSYHARAMNVNESLKAINAQK